MHGATPVLGRPGVEPPAAFASALSDASWIAIPLAVRGERVGIQLLASRTREAYGPAQSEIAATLAGQGMVAYENARLFHQIRVLATIDELSGIPNRRHFFALAEAALMEAHAGRHALAVLMLDIDRFKQINDTHGHQVGDEVIRTVAGRLRSIGRSNDVIGRYGGEEFGLLLQVATDDALAVAERVRRAIADEPIETDAGALAVTVSIGVACLESRTEPLASLLGRADARLYDAKSAGRNRVVAS
jgi:diguanylate cyclase (GGDEF)-like protein